MCTVENQKVGIGVGTEKDREREGKCGTAGGRKGKREEVWGSWWGG